MAIPKPKSEDQQMPIRLDLPDESPGPGLEDLVDNLDLLAEIRQWESASDEDMTKFESGPGEG